VTAGEFRSFLSERASSQSVTVSDEVAAALWRYFELLGKWNRTINLTALPLDAPSNETFDRLLIEPLAAANRIVDRPVIWFDLGSGGGSPAIPIKLARPRLRLTMVESRSRKAAFLREVVRDLPLKDAEVENARFEQLVPLRRPAGTAELVTVRAVKMEAQLLEVCRELLKPGGELILFGDAVAGMLDGFSPSRDSNVFVRCST